MNEFLSGALMICTFTIGLFFLKFWRKTQERLFLIFATSFGLLSIERWLFWIVDFESSAWTWIYLFRLAAFILIIYGIVDKNRTPNN